MLVARGPLSVGKFRCIRADLDTPLGDGLQVMVCKYKNWGGRANQHLTRLPQFMIYIQAQPPV